MESDSTPTTPVLRWRRWRRGGGQYAWHPDLGGPLYSLMPIRRPSGSYTGRYQLTDDLWRQGRTVDVADKDTGYAQAEAWFADGVPDDGYARLRAAWGTWHDLVPDGHVGVSVQMPGTGARCYALIEDAVYRTAQADQEKRIPVTALHLDTFHADSHTKQIQPH